MADPRSKIPQDCWGGILDRGSWIRCIEIQYGLNISIWASLNPRFLPGVPCNLGSWIRCIEIQYGFNVSIWPSLNPRFLPGVPYNLGSWIRHIEVQCVSIFQWGPLPFLVLLSPRLLCQSACLRHPKNQRCQWPPFPTNLQRLFFGLFGTVPLFSKTNACLLVSCKKCCIVPKQPIFLEAWGGSLQDWGRFFCVTVQHVGKKVFFLGQFCKKKLKCCTDSNKATFGRLPKRIG